MPLYHHYCFQSTKTTLTVRNLWRQEVTLKKGDPT